MIHSGGFLGGLLGPLLKTGLPLIKIVIKPLIKSILIPLGLTTAATVAVARIHKKILGSGTSTLIISNYVMEDIVKTVKSLEDSRFLLKGVNETIDNEAKKQKGRLLCTLDAMLLGNILAVKGINKSGYGNKKVKGVIRVSYGFKLNC